MSQGSSLWSDAWRRLLANKAAVAGGIILLVLIFLAIFAPWIAPHSYSYQILNWGLNHHLLIFYWALILLDEIYLAGFCMVPGFHYWWAL